MRDRREEFVFRATRHLRFAVEPRVVEGDRGATGQLLRHREVGSPVTPDGVARLQKALPGASVNKDEVEWSRH